MGGANGSGEGEGDAWEVLQRVRPLLHGEFHVCRLSAGRFGDRRRRPRQGSVPLSLFGSALEKVISSLRHRWSSSTLTAKESAYLLKKAGRSGARVECDGMVASELLRPGGRSRRTKSDRGGSELEKDLMEHSRMAPRRSADDMNTTRPRSPLLPR